MGQNIKNIVQISTNKLLNPTQRTIKNWNSDFMTSDGPQTSSFLSLSDLVIPYDSQYVSRLVLPADAKDILLNYDSTDGSTFLLIKVTYNGDYDFPQKDDYDPLYNQEPSNYNIEYYFDGNSGITYPIGRLLILNGSFTNKLPKIYLNNPLSYNVVLDVLQANLEAPPAHIPSSAITISNLYYSDVITNQVSCSSTGFTGTTTGSTEFIISEFKSFFTGFTISQYNIPYSAITSIIIDTTVNSIYVSTINTFYTIKFLTLFDCNQTYSRMQFVYSSHLGNLCRYLTTNSVYSNGSIVV